MLPSEIYVYGMPLNLSGWNGKYKLICDEYHLVNHSYYGMPIYHIYIGRENGDWCFKCGNNTIINGFNMFKGESPCGIWGDNIVVSETQTYYEWSMSNLWPIVPVIFVGWAIYHYIYRIL